MVSGFLSRSLWSKETEIPSQKGLPEDTGGCVGWKTSRDPVRLELNVEGTRDTQGLGRKNGEQNANIEESGVGCIDEWTEDGWVLGVSEENHGSGEGDVLSLGWTV